MAQYVHCPLPVGTQGSIWLTIVYNENEDFLSADENHYHFDVNVINRKSRWHGH